MTEKEKNERRQLKTFISSNNFEFKIINIQKDESPDFNLETSEGKIGIELTEFNESKTYNSLIKSNESSLAKIRTVVKQRLLEKSKNHICLNYELHYPTKIKITSKNESTFIEFLVSHLDKTEVLDGIKRDCFHQEFMYEKNEHLLFRKVSIGRMAYWTESIVSSNSEFWSGELNRTKISEVISNKGPKMDFTRNKLNWLIIILTETDGSDAASLDNLIETPFSPFGFDSVYIHRLKSNFTIQLPLGNT